MKTLQLFQSVCVANYKLSWKAGFNFEFAFVFIGNVDTYMTPIIDILIVAKMVKCGKVPFCNQR